MVSVYVMRRMKGAKLMARQMLAIALLSILVVIFCECGKDKGKEQARDTTDEVDKARAMADKDGAEMVLIPAGEFQMGSNDGYSNEKPVHTVYLDAFAIDKYELANAQYAQFLNEYGKNTNSAGHKVYELIYIDNNWCKIIKGGNAYRSVASYENHPVINVSWHGAAAYAQFYGKRLPTEAEWEKAARGGLAGKRFPWGDSDPDGTQSNFADKSRYRSSDHNLSDKSVDDGYQYTAPVGSFTPNGYGLYDMAGNVGEWCSDWYGEKYYSSSLSHNPMGPSSGTRRVVRGGSWNAIPRFVRVASRAMGPPTATNNNTGFRCASQP